MSTRCNIHFNDGEHVVANIYRHSDGYPDGEHGVPACLQRFFVAVETQCNGDTRFDDPEYLAAKFLVWQAHENQSYERERGEDPTRLKFTGVSPCLRDHGDIEHIYTVDCENLDQDRRPTVTHEEA